MLKDIVKHRFSKAHIVLMISICGIMLNHSKLLMMTWVRSLIAKIFCYFKNLLKHTYSSFFEIRLGGYT